MEYLDSYRKLMSWPISLFNIIYQGGGTYDDTPPTLDEATETVDELLPDFDELPEFVQDALLDFYVTALSDLGNILQEEILSLLTGDGFGSLTDPEQDGIGSLFLYENFHPYWVYEYIERICTSKREDENYRLYRFITF